MNLYAHDLSLFDFANFSDSILDPISINHHHHNLHRSFSSSSSSLPQDLAEKDKTLTSEPKSPPRHRHDGTSPLPLGMDWSLPPRKWDGRNTIWPHDPQTGWSYCVTIPSWIILPKSRGSGTVVFYRVQVGVESPEAITTTLAVLRRYSDFLRLLSELKKVFPKKNLPPAPPKKVLRLKSKALLEERRCSLEDWMEKLLSDIDVSRSATIGTFLELEAAARLCFDDVSQQNVDANAGSMVQSDLFRTKSDVSLLASIASNHDGDSADEASDHIASRYSGDNSVDHPVMEASTSGRNMSGPVGTVRYGTFNRNDILGKLDRLAWRKNHPGREKNVIDQDKNADDMSGAKFFLKDETKSLPEMEYQRLDGHVRRLSADSIGSDISSIRASEISNLFGDDVLDLPEGSETPRTIDTHLSSNMRFPKDLVIALPSDERPKMNRVLDTMRRRLVTAKTDMEDLMARLNQEAAVRQFLTTKVKDLEVDLETTRTNCKENMQQAVLMERERFTQMQWDVEELRKQCLDLELKLKNEQDEKALAESAKASVIMENELLLQQLDVTREKLENMYRSYEESELKSKADVKLLVKEVKSLRTSQSELKQELSRIMKEKIELERFLEKENQRMERVVAANTKLLRECEILRNRLQECSVNFLSEEEDKLIVDTSSPSDAIDLLTTSDNRIGLLLAEAQLLAQDIENSFTSADYTNGSRTDDELRKMLTEVFVDNARLRMHVNSVIRSALSAYTKSDKEEEDDGDDEVPLRKTVLSKFLQG